MSYTSNGNGIGMAANRFLGGLSLWSNYTDSSFFDNDQILIEFLLTLIITMVILVLYLLV